MDADAGDAVSDDFDVEPESPLPELLVPVPVLDSDEDEDEDFDDFVPAALLRLSVL